MSSALPFTIITAQGGQAMPAAASVPAPGRSPLHGDFVALVRFVGVEPDEPPRTINDARRQGASVTLRAHRFRVLASNQPRTPDTVSLLRERRPVGGSVKLLGTRDSALLNLPDPTKVYLLLGHRASEGALRGSDFGEDSLWGDSGSRIDAAPNEVAVERLEPTRATRLEEGRTPEEAYVGTRLLSMEAHGSEGRGDAAFFFRLVRDLWMTRPLDADAIYGKGYLAPGVRERPDLAWRIEKAVCARYPFADSVDERLLLASMLIEMGESFGIRLLDQAVEQAVRLGEKPSSVSTQTLSVVPHEAGASDRAFALVAQTSDPLLQAVLRRRADALPTTEAGWAGLRELLRSSQGDELHHVLSFVADRANRPDLRPSSLADRDVATSMERLRHFWSDKRLIDLKSIARPKMPNKASSDGNPMVGKLGSRPPHLGED